MAKSNNTRRYFLKTAGMGMAALSVTGCSSIKKVFKKPAQTAIPRWRGFNLQYFYTISGKVHPGTTMNPLEDDFKWISDWGFDYVRMPMSYILWIEDGDVYKIKESVIEKIDRAVDLGQKYGIHVSLNFHHAPGYCIHAGVEEPFDLWKDREALDAFCFHWEYFAKRYKGISPSMISYNLVNEAPRPRDGVMTRDDYYRVVSAATEVIRDVDPGNIVIADGLDAGNLVAHKLIPLGVAQSVHGYSPACISHYRAGWVDKGDFPRPVWPGVQCRGELWDRQRLEEHYAPWGELARQGLCVHMGECGGYNKTPHNVFMDWMRDVMDIMKGYNICYSLWDFRGGFGVLNTGRDDIEYEDWYGLNLDLKLLTMLQKF